MSSIWESHKPCTALLNNNRKYEKQTKCQTELITVHAFKNKIVFLMKGGLLPFVIGQSAQSDSQTQS